MATPPTFVTENEASTWITPTNPKTVSVTVTAGDVLAVFGMSEDSSTTLSTPTGGGLTYTLQQSITASSHATAYLWTTTSPTSQTFTLSVSATGGGLFGFNALQFSGSTGIGNSASAAVTGGAPSLALTTAQDNSAIVVASSDWAAIDGTVRTWRTGAGPLTEESYATSSTRYTIYGGFHADASAAGAKTVGLSAPTGQTYSIVAVEILGVAAAPPADPPGGYQPLIPVPPLLLFQLAARDQAMWQNATDTSGTVNGDAAITGAGALGDVPVVQQAVADLAGAGTATAPLTLLGSASIAGAGALAAPAVQQSGTLLTGAGTLAAAVTQQSGSTLAGAGSVSATVVQQVTASLAGAGTLTANAAGTVSGTATITGAGVLAVAATQGSGTSPAGAGVLTVLAVQRSAAALAGAGSLSAVATQQAGTGLTGAGALSAPAVQQATAALTGAGALSATGTIPGGGSATLTGAGALSATATQGSIAALTGSGALTVTATQNGKATLAGAGTVSAAGVVAGSAALTGVGALASPVRQLASASLVGAGALAASGGSPDIAVSGQLGPTTSGPKLALASASGRVGPATAGADLVESSTSARLGPTTSGGTA